MALRLSSLDFSRDRSEEWEIEGLIQASKSLKLRKAQSKGWLYSRAHIVSLYALISSLLLVSTSLTCRLHRKPFADPTLGVYCEIPYITEDPFLISQAPANKAVEYIREQKFESALFSYTPYMGIPTNKTDLLWENLYDSLAVSKISRSEANLLPHPTLRIPGTEDYLVQLDVFHQLHCLDDLRMLLYPERFPGLEELKDENGVINRDGHEFRHWDHCIDALRQTIMCHSDVSPVSWHLNMPKRNVIIPQLSTTHTCRNFTKIQEWARENSAGDWNYMVDSKEAADEIARTAGFDQAPDEDMGNQYDKFPGDLFFKYWRDHPKEAAEARKKAGLD
ncbi:Cyclochlorotine biosynthesis protein O [Lachnellula cervina]|uniref:Cyclochlorotine biosynthesis protein O n=1 Tax=Lachnellula cervina TaxID=1316786 RepID=A0A7D8UTP2_9HELO|nr:Cyclochlorotine biosynthesis protein O [Lachnellula cervina]